MHSDSPTRGFPYTNSRPPLAWSGPGLSVLIHPAAPLACVCVSVCVWVGVWELTSAVMTAHWKGTCGEPEPARSFQDACNQALRTVSLLGSSRIRRFEAADETPTAPWWKYMSVWPRWCAIQSEHVLFLLLDAFWPICRTPTLHSVHILIVAESRWMLLFWAFKAWNTNCGEHRSH